ncbi:hypothetical protein D3C72_1196200 [compost metagenome]
MGFAVFGEHFFQLWIQFAAIDLTRTFDHFDAAEWDQRAFQRGVSLQTYDGFQLFSDVASVMGSDGRGNVGVEINWRMGAVLQFDPFHNLVPQGGGGLSCASQEGFITLVRSVVFLDEVTNVDFVLPVTFAETFPSFG